MQDACWWPGLAVPDSGVITVLCWAGSTHGSGGFSLIISPEPPPPAAIHPGPEGGPSCRLRVPRQGLLSLLLRNGLPICF